MGAMGDTMVFPNEGEHWGTFGDNSFDKKDVLTMKETNVYKNDLFGLKTADEAGKIKFETTLGTTFSSLRNNSLGGSASTGPPPPRPPSPSPSARNGSPRMPTPTARTTRTQSPTAASRMSKPSRSKASPGISAPPSAPESSR